MPDFLISLALGGVVFLIVKWLIFRKPFPYPLSIAEQHNLGKTLTRLSDAFEAVEPTWDTQQIGEVLPNGQQASFITELQACAQSLVRFSPEAVTYVALGHMRTSQSLGRATRAQAQSRMLHTLQGEGLAASADIFT